MKRIIVVLMLVCAMAALSSCSVKNEFLATLGFDTHDYEGEAVIQTYDGESEKAEEMREMIRTLSVNSPYIPTFDGSKDAVSKCVRIKDETKPNLDNTKKYRIIYIFSPTQHAVNKTKRHCP